MREPPKGRPRRTRSGRLRNAHQADGRAVRRRQRFWQADSFAEAVLRAANLGDDADTTAAVCGQVAAAYFGLEAVPSAWLERLAMRETILRLGPRWVQGRPRCTLPAAPLWRPTV